MTPEQQAAEVLAAHTRSPNINSTEGWVECMCGAHLAVPFDECRDPDYEAEETARADHVAAALAAAGVLRDPDAHEAVERFVVQTVNGFTETFDAHTISTLEALRLIEHERDGHVLEDGHGNGVGPLHRFYRPTAHYLRTAAIDGAAHTTGHGRDEVTG